MTTTTARPSLARATARGAVWSYATFLVSKGVALLSTLVLARLLAPEDFGLLALALVVMNALDVINDLGIGSAVIWRGSDQERTSDVAFGLTMVVGLGLTILTVIASPAIAAAYGQPAVAPIIAALAVSFVIASVGSVQDARLRRDLAFQRRFVAELVKALVKAAVTVGLAAAGLGAWALVHGQLAGVTVGAAAYWVLARWRPRPAFDRDVAMRLVRYGGQITVLGLLGVVVSNVDYVVIGRRQDTEALGYYVLAFRLPGLLIITSCAVLSQVLFPAFTRVTADPASLRSALLRTIRVAAAVVVPIGVGIAIVAGDLVTVLFGDKWAPAAELMPWLAAYSVLSTLMYADGDVYKAIGRPSILNATATVQLAVAVPLLWWAAGSGIVAVAQAQVVVAGVLFLVRLSVLRVVLGVRPSEVGRALHPVAIGAAALAVGAGAVQLGLADVGAPARLLASIVVGAGAYAAGLLAVDRRWALDVLRLVGLRQGPRSDHTTARAVSVLP